MMKEEFLHIILEVGEEFRCCSLLLFSFIVIIKTVDKLVSLVLLLLLILLLLSRHRLPERMSVFALTPLTTMMEVVLISHADFLGLVSHQPDGPAHFGRHLALEAAFAQQTVDGLDLVPALFGGHFGQVRGRLLVAPLAVELDPDSVHAYHHYMKSPNEAEYSVNHITRHCPMNLTHYKRSDGLRGFYCTK